MYNTKEYSMKKLHFLCLASLLVLGWSAQGDAVPIRLEESVVNRIPNRQNIEVVIIDSQGHIYHQVVPYNPEIGGIDINIAEFGPHSSIYFPDLGFGYVWYNGYWVSEEGYYWDGQRRVYINDPNWKNYWVHYWQGNQYNKVRRGPWHQRTFDGRPRYDSRRYDSRYDSRYGNQGYYDNQRYRDFDDRQRGRWQQRDFDRYDRNQWSQDSMRRERRGWQGDNWTGHRQGNWDRQSSMDGRQGGWRDQPSTGGSQGEWRGQAPSRGRNSQTFSSNQSNWGSQTSTSTSSSRNTPAATSGNLGTQGSVGNRGNQLSDNAERDYWQNHNWDIDDNHQLIWNNDNKSKKSKRSERRLDQDNQEYQN